MKKIVLVLLILVVIAGGVGYMMWNKPHKKVEDAKGIAITSIQLTKEFAADENAANQKYLNKAIDVTGVVSDYSKNQDGGVVITLQGVDDMSGVQCTMRDKGATTEKGKTVTVKGFCSGYLMSMVSLTDCIIK